MNFSAALIAIKDGKKVARSGWNGKGMFVFLEKGSVDNYDQHIHPPYVEGISLALFENCEKGTSTRLPYLKMKTAQGYFVPWLASQTDILGKDWEVV